MCSSCADPKGAGVPLAGCPGGRRSLLTGREGWVGGAVVSARLAGAGDCVAGVLFLGSEWPAGFGYRNIGPQPQVAVRYSRQAISGLSWIPPEAT